MAKITVLLLLIMSSSTSYALELGGAAPEAQEYAACVYELKNVDIEDLSNEEDAEIVVAKLVKRAFDGCEREKASLRTLGQRRGLSNEALDQKMNETDRALEAALRLTIAREILKN